MSFTSNEERRVRAFEFAIEIMKNSGEYPITGRLIEGAAKIEEYLKSGTIPARPAITE